MPNEKKCATSLSFPSVILKPSMWDTTLRNRNNCDSNINSVVR